MLTIQTSKTLNENGQLILLFPSRLDQNSSECKLLTTAGEVMGTIAFIALNKYACVYQFTKGVKEAMLTIESFKNREETIVTMNYYVFPKIERDEDGTAWAYDNQDRIICEVFDFSADDTEEQLIREGFAKCDAPGTETFLVEETAWEAYQSQNEQV